jgi:uncharacterized protein YjlB
VTAEPTTALLTRLHVEGLDPESWSNGPGDRYAAHEHGYDKVIVVAEGSIEFGVVRPGGRSAPAGRQRVQLDAGDRLELPAGTSHEAVVGQLGATCLEAHLAAGRLAELRRRGAGDW